MPRTAEEFAEHFMRSPIAQRNREDMDQYKEAFVGIPERAIAYKESVKAEHSKTARKKSYVFLSLSAFGFCGADGCCAARTQFLFRCKLRPL